MSERSEFHVAKMDCSAEEQAVRLALESVPGVTKLSFDLPERRLVVLHADGASPSVDQRLQQLGLESKLLSVAPAEGAALIDDEGNQLERRTLWSLLGINAAMFVLEGGVGLAVQSVGLLADSLDMLADAMVYGLSLYAVGRAASQKLRAAHVSGWLQIGLAMGALAEVIRRFVGGSEPEAWWMSGMAVVALAANVTCLVLVARHRQGGAHMKASYIFSTNDVIANVGVLLAGGLVGLTGSRLPDLVIGAIIAAVVLAGGVRILRIKA